MTIDKKWIDRQEILRNNGFERCAYDSARFEHNKTHCIAWTLELKTASNEDFVRFIETEGIHSLYQL